MNHKLTIAIITVITLWSSSYVAIRIGLADFSPGAMALFRYLIASIVMTPFYFNTKNRTAIQAKDLPILFLLGAIGIGIYNIALNIGEQSVSAGMTGFIIAQVPVVAVILANLFLKERLTLTGWAGIAISFIGICLISFGISTPQQFNHGIWFLLVSAVCGALYSVIQKPLMRRYKPIEIATYAMWSGTVFLLFWSPTLTDEIRDASLSCIVWVVYLGIFPAAAAYYCWAYIINHLPASKAVSYLYWIPGISTLLGWLILGEVPAALGLLGGILAMAGAVLVRVK